MMKLTSVLCALLTTPALAQTSAPVPAAVPAPQGAQPVPPTATTAQPVTPMPSAPPVLGRLFFTPSERARIDELRRKPPAPPPQVAVAEPPRKVPPPPQYVTLNGIVQRSDGQTTVWLNNKPVRGGRSEEGVVVAPAERTGVPSGVKVTVPQTGRSADLKVGQQLEVNSGQVQESYRTPRAPVTIAPAETKSEAAAARSETLRRASRERDLLRDLLREIEGSAATKPEQPAPPSAKTP